MAATSDNSETMQKTLRSLLAAFSLLEREGSYLLERLGVEPRRVGELLEAAGVVQAAEQARAMIAGRIAALLGLAEESSVVELRAEVERLLAELQRMREREEALTARVAQLEAANERFGRAVEELARVQGRCAAQLERLAGRADRLEERITARKQRRATLGEINVRAAAVGARADGLAASRARRVASGAEPAPRVALEAAPATARDSAAGES